MKIGDAFASLHQEHPEDVLNPLYTPWGEEIEEGTREAWQEYPRPQLVREQYKMLNGMWDYCIVPTAQAGDAAGPQPGRSFKPDGQIRVPFSPECLLSGVGRQLKPDEYLWYQCTFSLSKKELAWKKFLHRRCLLHFDAVDQQATVYINGAEAASHTGGYLPFVVDITDLVQDASCLLQVRVRDESDTSYHARGKQTLKRGGMFYTAQSGIWQSVWYEWVPENYIQDCRITPDYDHQSAEIVLLSSRPFDKTVCRVRAAVCDADDTPSDLHNTSIIPTIVTIADQALVSREENGMTRTTMVVTIPGQAFEAWTPEEPWLYPFTVTAYCGKDEDTVKSYLALRSFTVEKDAAGIPRFHLNHKPYFLHGLLDQGYWSDGLMTAPCDEAWVYDIKLSKKLGFNMLRKHVKIEALRWYYHCDRMGMIVWQDMVSGGTAYRMPLVCYMPTLFPHISSHTRDHHYRLFSRASAEGRKSWEKECSMTIDLLYNVPSIAVWVPFNEGWGQFDAARITKMIQQKDPTRPIDHASGWFDQRAGDFRSIHNYFRPLKVKLDGERAFVISEYGGYACFIQGHSSVDRVYGYQKYDTPEELAAAFKTLVEEKLKPLEAKGLSGAVYTQLSDVEEEVNGLVTYDRKIVKL